MVLRAATFFLQEDSAETFTGAALEWQNNLDSNALACHLLAVWQNDNYSRAVRALAALPSGAGDAWFAAPTFPRRCMCYLQRYMCLHCDFSLNPLCKTARVLAAVHMLLAYDVTPFDDAKRLPSRTRRGCCCRLFLAVLLSSPTH